MSETGDVERKNVYNLLNKYNETSNQVDLMDIEIDLLKMKKKLSSKFRHKLRYQLPEYFLDKYPEIQDDGEEYNDKNKILPFELSVNQRFLKKFMSLDTRNRSLLLFHGVGVGKTCASVSIAENFHNNFSNMKRTIVLSNKVIRQNFENELFDLKDFHNSCVGGKYVEMIQDWRTIPKKMLLKKIKKNIEFYYDFKGYIEFSNEIYRKKQKLSEDDYMDYINNTFSNRLIIIDEIHNLRSNDSTKKIPVLLEDVIKFSTNLRLLYLSATPMFDDYSEIIWLFNTLHSVEKSDKRLSSDVKFFDENGNVFEMYKTKIRKFAYDHVSYMRGENPFTFPLRVFPSVNNDSNILQKYPSKDVYGKKIPENEILKFTEIVTSIMSKDQYNVYKTIDYKNEESEKNEEEQSENNKDMQKRIQLSNIYFPTEGSIKSDVGKKGLLRVMDEKTSKTGVTFKYKSDTVKIFESDHLNVYSPKIKTIIDYVNNSNGVVIIYSKFIYSGIIPIALSLESAGYSRYKEKNLLDDNTNKQGKKFKYSIISGDSRLSPSKEKLIDVIRSYENRNGDLVKIVLISQVATEGVDFKNVREIHLLEPWFNMSKVEQIIGRGVRRYSHINLKPSERNTTIYLHANVLPNKDDRESVDLRMYRISELKQYKISQIERLLKEGSVDCNLNKNVLFFDKDKIDKIAELHTSQGIKIMDYKIGDTDYSKLCDFQKCAIQCYPNILRSRSSSDHLNFSVLSYEVSQYIKRVSNVFKSEDVTFLTYKQLRNFFPKITKEEEHIFNYALSKMIDDKITFKFRKIESYIVHNSNKYIVHPSNLDDQKVPLNLRQREYLKRPLKLSLKNWKGKVKTNVVVDEKTNVVKSPKKSSPNMIMMSLEDKYKELYDILSNIYSENDINQKHIWSMVIDKLNIHEHKNLVTYLKKTALRNKELIECLNESLVYFLDDSNKLNKVYDYIENKIVKYNEDGKETKLTQGMIAQEMKELNKTVQAKLSKINIQEVLGFTEFSSTQKTAAFKMSKQEKESDKESKKQLSGAICLQTSQYTKKVMNNYIRDAIGKKVYDEISDKLDKMKKMHLCVLYEYVSRILPNKYMRPMYVKVFQDDKNKN
jgi:superfamily II DNA or RNA helicase